MDDEPQIHRSLRLRLAGSYEIAAFTDARAALSEVKGGRFDLCIVDLHMPKMNGLSFIEAAREIDAGLGFVILSEHGTEENLRRTIPLQVYDFICKPLSDGAGLEQQLPAWIERTRRRRRELALVRDGTSLIRELNIAYVERDIEFTASESARDALLQSSNLLTTISALLASASHFVNNQDRHPSGTTTIKRTIQEAQKAAEAASAVANEFFNSAYANRDTTPAHLGNSLRSAAGISRRWAKSDHEQKALDIHCPDENAIVRGLSGIDLLLLLVTSIGTALEIAPAGTTMQIRTAGLVRLDSAQKDSRTHGFTWTNRRHALHSHGGVLLTIRTNGPALDQAAIKQWLEGAPNSPIRLPARGLVHGVTKCQGLLGFSATPHHERFELAIALPT